MLQEVAHKPQRPRRKHAIVSAHVEAAVGVKWPFTCSGRWGSEVSGRRLWSWHGLTVPHGGRFFNKHTLLNTYTRSQVAPWKSPALCKRCFYPWASILSPLSSVVFLIIPFLLLQRALEKDAQGFVVTDAYSHLECLRTHFMHTNS